MPSYKTTSFFQRLIVSPPFTAFLLGLFWALLAMTVSRIWLVPNYIPSENGHILGDPLLYHNMALEQVRIIGEQGLGAFQLHFGNQGTAGVTSLLYLIYPSPFLVLMLNALLHAIACAAVTRLLMVWFSPIVSLIATVPLLISPANIFWLAQINKESYAIAGCALLFLGYTLTLKHALNRQFKTLWLLVAVVGIFLVYIPRPHLNQMLMLGFAVTSVLVIGTILLQKNNRAALLASIQAVVLGIAFVIFSQGGLADAVNQSVTQAAQANEISRSIEAERQAEPLEESDVTDASDEPKSPDTVQAKNRTSETTDTELVNKQEAENPQAVTTNSDTTGSAPVTQPEEPLGVICYRKLEHSNWQVTEWLPTGVNSRLRALASLRCHNHELHDVHDNPTTKQSIADTHVFIEGTKDMIAYAPRALQLGFFGPLPSQWPSGTFLSSFFYTIVPVMMVFFYLGMVATVVWVVRSKAWLVLPVFMISIVPVWIYGISASFLGALFRYRYPIWIVLFCIGAAALLTIAIKQSSKLRRRVKYDLNEIL